jgi:hypothetical protein
MAFVVEENQQASKEKPPTGTFRMTFIGPVDQGISVSDKYLGKDGKPKQTNKMSLHFQLSESDSTGQPFVLSKWFTRSLAKPPTGNKAALRETAEVWLGYDGGGIDWDTLVGTGAMGTLVEKNGFVRIATIAPLMKNDKAPEIDPGTMERFQAYKAQREAAVLANNGMTPTFGGNGQGAHEATITVSAIIPPPEGKKSFTIKTTVGQDYLTKSAELASKLEHASGEVKIKYNENDFQNTTYRFVEEVLSA